MPPSPRRRQEAAAALARTAPLVSRWIERLLAAHEPPLTVAQYLALEAVGAGGVAASDLARRAAVSPSAVSQLVAGLEGAGLVERVLPAEDRRRRPLALTARGETALHSAQALLRERLAAFLAGLPPPETDALARLLAELESALAGTAPPPRPPHPPRARRGPAP
jgi:DNA-binding MarR family transcriptional regulator